MIPQFFGRLRDGHYHRLSTPLAIFLISRSLIWVIGFVARVAFSSRLGDGPWHTHPGQIYLDIWDRWDSAFYRGIARQGYVYLSPDEPGNVVFFPLYPLLTRLAHLLAADWTIAGLLVSHVCLLLALVVLYNLTLLEFGDRATAQRAIFYIAIFPTAFFFSAVYSESTFLLFAVACVYFTRRREWLPAGVCGLLAATARVTGVLLYGYMLLEWASAGGLTWRNFYRRQGWAGVVTRPGLLALLATQLVPLGLLLYMLFLQWRFGNALAFVQGQADWGRGSLYSPLAILWRDFRPLLLDPFVPGWAVNDIWRTGLDALLGVGALLLVPFVWRRLNAAYALYTAVAVLLPLATGTTMSLSRYVLVLFPLFMLLAWWGRHPLVDRALTLAFALLLGILLTVFVNWGFVA